MRVKKEVLNDWDIFIKNVIRETEIPFKESEGDKAKRIKALLSDFEAFCKYYFPNYASADFAPFHLRFAKKLIDNDKIYIIRAWAREHAKSVVAGLFVPLFLKFNKRLFNMLLISNSYEKAEELLMPIMVNLEFNQRLINDFGLQKSWRGWEMGKFVTQDGCSFRALGAGQSPRGSRNEEKRPDFVLFDDIDTDEESRNQARIDRKFQWIEQALFPAMSISGVKRFVGVGNIISKESVIVKASRVADDYEVINILDKKGNPSWNRYSKEDVNYMLSKISYASGQKEYFNNPLSEGTVFKDIIYGKVPPLSKFKCLVCYTDPSFKDTKKSDYKATVLVGLLEDKYYVVKAFVEQTTTEKMVLWHYEIKEFVAGRTTVYYYVEHNLNYDIIDNAVTVARKTKGELTIMPDKDGKTDKFSRIEATLEPLNSRGRLIFNEDEKGNPHMKTLDGQMRAIEPSLPAHDDGPDALQGAVDKIDKKHKEPPHITVLKKKKSSLKY
jgi:hypothetical protein